MIPNSYLDATEHWLWRYDDALLSWSDTGVAIHGCSLKDPKLLATSGKSPRMLLAAWKTSSSGSISTR